MISPLRTIRKLVIEGYDRAAADCQVNQCHDIDSTDRTHLPSPPQHRKQNQILRRQNVLVFLLLFLNQTLNLRTLTRENPNSSYIFDFFRFWFSIRIAFQSSFIEPSMLQNLNCIYGQMNLTSLISHRSFISPVKAQSHEPWTRVITSSQSYGHSLQCHVCLDRITETRVDSWRKNRNEVREDESSGRIFVKNDEQTNNDLLQSLCRRWELLKAARLVALMSRINQIPDFDSCMKLIRGLVKLNYTDRASEVLNCMVMSGGVPDIITYNMLISGLCKNRCIDAALDLLDGMSVSGCPPDGITYNAIIRVMLEHGYLNQAVSFWKDQLAKGCTPYASTSSVLVELVCKSRGVIRAIEILQDLAGHGCNPDLVTYNSIINVTSKRGNFGDTILIINDLLSHGMEPNTVMYTTLIHSFFNHGYFDKVDEILSLMNETSKAPTMVTYNILIKGFCTYGFLDRAIGFFNEMVLHNCSPDIITYNTLLRALCDEGMMDLSLQIVDCLKDSNTPPSLISYNILIDGLAKRGDMEKAVGLYQDIMKEKTVVPDDVTHRSLIWGFCHADMVDEAVKILKVMEKNGHRATHGTYKYIIHKLCQKHKLGDAMKVLKMLISSPNRPYGAKFYSDMIGSLSTDGMNEEAKQLHQKLIEWKVV
ncbi:hypothetical protein L1987_15912 [Smallanthus sonchifolius]|uniref:Uncharacterized protein n=1 Tax=Smallanthus sonchifolius TaxID=185202 RepID=A0ACB9J901_9ASTR|nr:hypothetical protein L1987_15912 [Smallanthus sonchifolius]